MNNNEVESYIELKYFPVEYTHEYFIKLPEDCIYTLFYFIFSHHGPDNKNYVEKSKIIWYYIGRMLWRNHKNEIQEFNNELKQSLIKHYTAEYERR